MLPSKYQKQSFIRFSHQVDTEKLENDFAKLSSSDWHSSYWGNVHCSVGMILLRGGKKGTPEDFYCSKVYDNTILNKLPYIQNFISEKGPFGKAHYAFIFNMKPNGVTLRHQDLMDIWKSMYRIHIPIFTNKDAVLVSNGFSQHFAKGFAWSFDNHSDHGVVNGNTTRTHLIIDVPFNEKLKQQLDSAEIISGEKNLENEQKITIKTNAVASYIGDIEMGKGIATLKARGLSHSAIADFINSKGLPTKSYNTKQWTESMISEFLE